MICLLILLLIRLIGLPNILERNGNILYSINNAVLQPVIDNEGILFLYISEDIAWLRFSEKKLFLEIKICILYFVQMWLVSLETKWKLRLHRLKNTAAPTNMYINLCLVMYVFYVMWYSVNISHLLVSVGEKYATWSLNGCTIYYDLSHMKVYVVLSYNQSAQCLSSLL